MKLQYACSCSRRDPLRDTGGPDHVLLCAQASLYFVLKESFKIYKAISEGLINLADKFFEMDYLAAAKGMEIYKESIVASERLQVGADSLYPTGISLESMSPTLGKPTWLISHCWLAV